MKLLFTLIFLTIAKAETLYYFTDREYMNTTYQTLASLLENSVGMDPVRLQSDRKHIRSYLAQMNPGDLFILDAESPFIYKELGESDSIFDWINQRGVKIHLVKHKTTEEVSRDIFIRGRENLLRNRVRIISPNHADTLLLNSLSSRFEISDLQNLELVNFKSLRKLSAKDLKILELQQKKKVILFAQQYHEAGKRALFRFLDYLKDKPQLSTKMHIIVALHPREMSLKTIDPKNIFSQFEKLSIQLFHSGEQYRTIDLFPHIDGVISLSSTVQDLANSLKIPTLSPHSNLDFTIMDYSHLDEFFQSLKERPKIEAIVDEVINSWKKNLLDRSDQRSCLIQLLNLWPFK